MRRSENFNLALTYSSLNAPALNSVITINSQVNQWEAIGNRYAQVFLKKAILTIRLEDITNLITYTAEGTAIVSSIGAPTNLQSIDWVNISNAANIANLSNGVAISSRYENVFELDNKDFKSINRLSVIVSPEINFTFVPSLTYNYRVTLDLTFKGVFNSFE